MVAALYRRYRPDIFADMIGQSQVTDPLMTALRTGRVNHAYLFSGPRGCGKTSSARILARCLNCAQGPTDTPCGECDSCRELARDGGGSLDVIEIDAASHGGVDDARDLRERAVLAPSRDRYKIFIIDEAHMVTAAGFNALLKVVEEPPAHVRFVFATTEPEKVIGTIRSRTHHFPFRLIPPALMLEYVEQLCVAEGLEADAGVLPLVVRAGGGSARDTLSLLDQIMAGSEGDRIDYGRAAALLGFTSTELLDGTVDAFAAGDAAAAYRAIDGVVQSGQDPRRFVEDLLERVRDLILVKATGDGAAQVLRGIGPAELERLVDQSSRFSPAGLTTMADLVNETLTEMTGVTSPRLHLELMTARILVASRATFAADADGGAAPVIERRDSGAAPAQAAQPAQPVTSAATSGAAEVSRPASATAPVSAGNAAPAGGRETSRRAPDSAAQAPAAERAAAQAEPAAATSTAPAAQQRPPRQAPAGPEPARAPAGQEQPAPAPSRQEPAKQEPAQAAPAPVAPGQSAAQPADDAAPPSGPITFARLRDTWPTVLERVKAAGGTPAWSTVVLIQPRDFVDGVLRFEVEDRGKLDRFRTAPRGGGSAPSDLVRDAIRELLGVTVKFQPRILGGRATGDRPTESAPRGDAAGDVHRAGAAGGQPDGQPGGPVGRQSPAATQAQSPANASSRAPQAGTSRPPAPSGGMNWTVAAIPDAGAPDDGPGSAWAEAAHEVDAPSATPAPILREPDDADRTGGHRVADAADAAERAEAGRPAAVVPPVDLDSAVEVIALREQEARRLQDEEDAAARRAAAPAGAAEPTPSAAAAPKTPPPPVLPRPAAPAPGIGGVERYGESVVRELLGARFVGEEALPEPAAPEASALAGDLDDVPPPSDDDAPPEEE